MSKILVSGATGNVGKEVIRALQESDTTHEITCGVRNPEESREAFPDTPQLKHIAFDFEKPETFDNALLGQDRIFLLRPPQISSVEKYFRPLMQAMRRHRVREVVFLSVQGVEQSSVIPHYQIEKLIREYAFSFVFLRPGYFMQNLETALYHDIRKKKKIVIPAGNARFNWVDTYDIGNAAAEVLNHFEQYRSRAFDITGPENLTFKQVSDVLGLISGTEINYESPNLISFFSRKKKDGVATPFILVMIMLHYLPRFQKPPRISDAVYKLTGKQPNYIEDYLKREKDKFRV
jgi:uncharacterized protein YbjT (DUF2867 family)